MLRSLLTPLRLTRASFSSSSLASAEAVATEIDLDSLFIEKIDPNKPKPSAGRAWRVDELRLKSDEDLDKLWYVLVKEQNMLYSTKHALKAEQKTFPDKHRIAKVKQTMARIRTVLSEREHARRFQLMETQFKLAVEFRNQFNPQPESTA
eukprot:TRINITY_DN58_c0_g2_i1.p1 TRINITY_DN58_c0_g2~~TRINITY_DN58_c0_g2_i1.p1  ORF type:complete len:150 (-),score=42.29 TRINITY_DN58_c0_g2_i1:471-920(-)